MESAAGKRLFSTASLLAAMSGFWFIHMTLAPLRQDSETARGIGQLEAAQNLHQTFNLTSGGGPTRFKVLLHTQARKERQNHTR
jgi:hypothetical protein